MIEQRGEVGIVELVVDDEADVDGDGDALIVDADGMAMASGAEFTVVDRDRIAFRERPRRGIARYSRTDNRDALVGDAPLKP